ncbi:MAG TPA: carboxypeptidase-like regulatory domain-containing protein [Bryobacteraceae bacterium]|nr:carboxypeptidase-like regulatory domain-containing protein [Bryobacteraceae bacterium]
MRLLWLCLLPGLWCAAQETPEPGTLTGIVLDANTGEPVARAALTLSLAARPGLSIDELPPHHETITASNGRFRFIALPPGRYYLRARKAGYLLQHYNPRPRATGAASIPVSAGPAPTQVEMRLLPQAVVSGRVLDENGEPVERAHVALEALEYSPLGRQQLWPTQNTATSDLGEFRFAGLPPGRYYLWTRLRPTLMIEDLPRLRDPDVEIETDYVPVYYPNSPDIEGATPIDLEPGSDIQGLDIRPRKFPVYRISGRVAAHDVPGAPTKLMLFPHQSSPLAALAGPRTRIQPDGRFEFAGVPPGRYHIAALHEGGEGRNPWLWQSEVHIGKRDVTNVTIAYNEPARIACDLSIEGDDSDAPTRAPIVVSLMPMEGPIVATPHGRSEHRRTFAIESVVPGHYWVQVSGRPQPDSWLKSIIFDGREVDESGLVLQPGASARLTLVFAPNAASLAGAVVNRDGETVPGVTVALVPERPNPTRRDLYPTAVTSSDGSVELKDLAPGRYFLFAFDHLPPGAHLDPEFLKPHLSRATRLEIEPGGRHQITLRHRATPAK